MRSIAVLIFVGFLSILVMGFMPAAFTHDVHHEVGAIAVKCPIAMISNGACVPDGFSMALTHISVLQSLLSVPLSIILVLVAVGACVVLLTDRALQKSTSRVVGAISDRGAVIERKIRAWLSLFELSPSTANGILY